MHTFWRLVLVGLMAVALPLQGLAAAAMLHCASMPQERADHASHMHEHMHEQMLDEHTHADPAAHAPGHDAPTDNPSDLPAQKCSACAACCLGVGLPADGTPLPIVRIDTMPQPGANAPAPRFVAGGPERPPRTDLA